MHENVWNTGSRFLCDMGPPSGWGLAKTYRRVAIAEFVNATKDQEDADHNLVNRIANKIEKLGGWLEVSNEPHGQPSLNASFSDEKQATVFAKWYDKQF